MIKASYSLLDIFWPIMCSDLISLSGIIATCNSRMVFTYFAYNVHLEYIVPCQFSWIFARCGWKILHLGLHKNPQLLTVIIHSSCVRREKVVKGFSASLFVETSQGFVLWLVFKVNILHVFLFIAAILDDRTLDGRFGISTKLFSNSSTFAPNI